MKNLVYYAAIFYVAYFPFGYSSNVDLIYSTSVGDVPANFYKLVALESNPWRRSKRDTNPVLFHQEDEEEATEDGLKPINETVFWNSTFKQIDYRYYEMSAQKDKFSQYWIDIPTLLRNNTTIKGEVKHKQLANSYRRAVSQKLTFKFPFYGHETENVTIATGGFVYAGDHVHSWLAATQYIAPLMANFDTTSSEDSNILYADNGEFFVVEWNQVVLRHQAEAGNFTFQVSLHKNGDIWFVYKNIPLEAKYVSDLHHPRKVGLSDAYLYNHNILALSRRVIYEYHRVEVNLDFVSSGSVVILKAQPVCVMLKDCRLCMSANLTNFNCTWCNVGDSNAAVTDGDTGGDQLNLPSSSQSFCSDQDGLNRRRQDWLDYHCNKQPDQLYCNDDVVDKDVDRLKTTTLAPPFDSPLADDKTWPKMTTPPSTVSTMSIMSTVQVTSPSDRPVKPMAAPTPLKSVKAEQPTAMTRGRTDSILMKKVDQQNGMSAGGIFTLILVLSSLISMVAWYGYAYTNPQTPSGQFLIRNRPSRWRWPSNHGDVRYTASSVHM